MGKNFRKNQKILEFLGEIREAAANLRSSAGSFSLGTITFHQAGPGEIVTISGTLSNLSESAAYFLVKNHFFVKKFHFSKIFCKLLAAL